MASPTEVVDRINIINQSYQETNAIFINIQNNITKVEKKMKSMTATKTMEEMNEKINSANQSLAQMNSALNKVEKSTSKKLTLANINILIGWAKSVLSVADSTGKINAAMNQLGQALGTYLNPIILAFSNVILFIAANMQLFLPLLWVLIAALGIYYSAQIQAAVATALACAPLIILLKTVLLIVGALYLVVNIVNRATGSSVSALGVIVGAFYTI